MCLSSREESIFDKLPKSNVGVILSFLLNKIACFPLFRHVPVSSWIRDLNPDMHLFSADTEIIVRYLCRAVLILKFSKNQTHYFYEVKVSVFKIFYTIKFSMQEVPGSNPTRSTFQIFLFKIFSIHFQKFSLGKFITLVRFGQFLTPLWL